MGKSNKRKIITITSILIIIAISSPISFILITDSDRKNQDLINNILTIGFIQISYEYINAKVPIMELPVHDIENVTGIQTFHETHNGKVHLGFDFKLENDTEIFAPIGGNVFGVEKKQMSNGYWIIDVKIRYNIKYWTFIAFEPWTENETIIDQQMINITVEVGENVIQNQSLGYLTPVNSSEFPHVHWSVCSNDMFGMNLQYLSPYNYSSAYAKGQLDWLCSKFGKPPSY
ncbi:MAG: M23 family metallopeptidase [Candidatus Helarchaeota archaeon]